MITSAKVIAAIVEAATLQREIKQKSERVGELKEILRVEASKIARKTDSEELVEFDSPEGVATVCFVRDAAGIIKGSDPLTLRETMALSKWQLLFETKIVLTDEFHDAFTLLPKVEQKAVSKVVEWKAREPRVTLPK